MFPRNRTGECNWLNQANNEKHNGDPDNRTKWQTADPEQYIKINGDKILYEDNTGVASKQRPDILRKLQTYGHVATRNHLLPNRGDFCIV